MSENNTHFYSRVVYDKNLDYDINLESDTAYALSNLFN